MQYPGIHIEGNIISSEILEKVRMEDIAYQQPADFGLEKIVAMRDEIGYAWQAARLHWQAFQLKRERMQADDSGASDTRMSWMIPLLRELGYEVERGKTEYVNERSYPLSHRLANRREFPVHIVGINEKLDRRSEHGAKLRLSPHGLMQEYLNYTEHLFGLVTNGRFLRLLRDATRLSRLAYLEFNLEKIMEEELYADFALMYRLLHLSRLPESPDDAENAILEFYHQESIQSGARIREKLREAVEEGMKQLANGWLSHPDNFAFTEAVRQEAVNASEFYQKLLTIIYRLLFLVVIEERNLVFPNDKNRNEGQHRLRHIYRQYYSIERLQKLALKKHFIDGRKTDLWQSIRATFSLFDGSGHGKQLGIAPLGGDLFSQSGLALGGFDLMNLSLDNNYVLDVIGGLTLFKNEQKQLVRINYTGLDVEELGSVYEALLDLNPRFNVMDHGVAFSFTEGTERKETGSYYTRSDLVQELIKSALDPVVAERLREAPTKEAKEQALLNLKVCDSAAGSGHFLLAAARRIAMALARLRSDEENPGEEWYRPAMRDVIQRCIYGVDKNPAAVSLCRLALWLEGHNPGKPLSFLDHKVKVGDSLIGVDRLERLKDGIPDNAFKPGAGDDKKVASYFKKQNSTFLKKQQLDLFAQGDKLAEGLRQIASEFELVGKFSEETLEEQRQKKEQYENLRRGNWMADWTACNLFTYAFFQPFTEDTSDHLVITSELLSKHLKNPGATHSQVVAKANAAAMELRFFHWPLEFPEVFEHGGFDVMLGNPPWERIKLQEQEFFATRDRAIAEAPNKAAREKLIKQLPQTKPALYQAFQNALHESEAASNFIRESGRYPLTGRGDVNTYSIFSELNKKNTAPKGRAGFIVPTGIATDDTNKYYFGSLIEENRLISLFDFENRKKIFPTVDSRYKFSLITLSGAPLPAGQKARFGFFLHDVLDLDNDLQVFELKTDDFIKINPNTKTCPVFRTSTDAKLTINIYQRVPVLVDEENNMNSWDSSYMRLVDLGDHSDFLLFNCESKPKGFVPLYESKLIWHYDHRFSSFDLRNEENLKKGNSKIISGDSKSDASFTIESRYLVRHDLVSSLFEKYKDYDFNWLVIWRDVSNATNERTMISCIIPKKPASRTSPALNLNSVFGCLLVSNFNSIIFDFLARQKIGGLHFNWTLLKQMPVFPEKFYSIKEREILLPKLLELTYTSWDIKAFADDLWREADDQLRAAIQAQWESNRAETGGHEWALPEWKGAYPEIAWEREAGCPLPPFKWDDNRRARLQAELDAYYAKLYGLSRDELRYILDPQDVYGEDFPGETFRVLKEKELKQYGEYRTRRLVLEAYDALSWFDEQAQVEKLEGLMEEYRREGAKSAQPPAEAEKQKVYPLPAQPARAAESEPAYPAGSLFSPPQQSASSTAGPAIQLNSKVIIEDDSGARYEYHVHPQAKKGQYSGTCRQVGPYSPLYLSMKGKRVGERFEFGGKGYRVVEVG